MNYIDIPCCKGKKVRIKATGLIHSQRSAYQEIAIYDTEEFGRCLFLDDTIQCSEKDHELYDRALLNKLRQTDKRILILGGGDGYTAETALKINPNAEITVVELDKEVIYACKKHLGQGVFDHPNVTLIFDDAFHYMKQADKCAYNGIVCDLTDFPVGYNDGKFREFYASVFPLSRKVLKDGGWIGVYAGSRDAVSNGGMPIASALEEMLTGLFAGTERQEALIPSYGEPVCFLYGLLGARHNMQAAEAVIEVDEMTFKDVIAVVKAASVDGLNDWEDSEDYIRDKIGDIRNINIILKDDGMVVGYLMAVPHNNALAELIEEDSLLREDAARYYVELVEILPEFRLGIGLLKLLFRMFEEAEKRFGVNKFSMHARVNTGLSRVVQRYFGNMITSVRRVEHWKYYSGSEPADRGKFMVSALDN